MSNFQDAHIRSFQAMHFMVEDKLQEMEDILCSVDEKRDENTQFVTDLTKEEKDIIKEHIVEMRQFLEQFASEYGLHKRNRSVKKNISIKAAFLWEELSGATFDRLQGYGKVDALERNRYEQFVEPMIKLAETIMLLHKII